MTTPEGGYSPGIYHIVVANLRVADSDSDVNPERLTRCEGGGVTIAPPSVDPDPEQEWEIAHIKGGNFIIKVPGHIRPGSYLTYKNAPEEPKKGDLVEYGVAEFPLNEWYFPIAPGFRHYIQVSKSNLGISIVPSKSKPPVPVLELAPGGQEWLLQRIRDE